MPTKSKNRARARGVTTSEELLPKLTLDEIWTALCELSGKAVARPSNRGDACEQVAEQGRTEKRILSALHRVEALSTKPHCYFATFSAPATFYASLEEWLGEVVEGARVAHVTVGARGDEKIGVTLERAVAIDAWSEDQTGAFRQTSRFERHATIVWFDRAQSRMVLGFKGFETGNRDRYEEIVSDNLAAIQAMGCRVVPLPARLCINALLEADPRRILITGTTQSGASGSLALRGRGRTKTIEEVVQGMLGLEMTAEMRKSMRLAMQETSIERTFVWWLDESLVTRIEFWSEGADFLLSWLTGEESFAALERVMDLLFGLAKDKGDNTTAGVWSAIAQLETGHVINPAEFQSRFALSPAKVREVIGHALHAGILQPVYRLNAPEDVLHELDRDEWSPDLLSLRRHWVSDSGLQIDGADPKNIAVAFKRTERAGADEQHT